MVTLRELGFKEEDKEKYEEAMGKASNDDRLWFMIHPEDEFRARKPIPYEFPPKIPVDVVVVKNVTEGVRLRFPMTFGTALMSH